MTGERRVGTGEERSRSPRWLFWVIAACAAVSVVGSVIEGRYLIALAFAVVGASAMSRSYARPSGSGRTYEVVMAAGFAAVALLVWIPLLTAP